LSTFTTEFPVREGISAALFVTAVKSWATGIASSQLDLADMKPEDEDTVLVSANDGKETLEIRRANTDGIDLLGVRYETERTEGIRFSVDAVLKCSQPVGIVSVRARSEVLDSHGLAPMPQKPALIKCMLERDWSDPDDPRHARLRPHYFGASDSDAAVSLLNDGDPSGMPFVYISAFEDGSWPIDPTKLANDLSGLANVFVEPNRSFSLNLRSRVANKNPYLGACGLWFEGGKLPTITFARGRQLVDSLKSSIVKHQAARSLKRGVDWIDLLEAQTRNIRERARAKIHRAEQSAQDLVLNELVAAEESHTKAIQQKNTEIDDLRGRLEKLEGSASTLLFVALSGRVAVDKSPDGLTELYEGEAVDRLIGALACALEAKPLESRTAAVAKSLLAIGKLGGGASGLKARIEAACKDGPASVVALLKELGFDHSNDGKHHKLKPRSDLLGVEQFTISKTPSDHRAAKNLASTITNGLGLREAIKK
jgi:hypothetical protein